MRTNIIQIGNSKGIRIPALILKECNLSDEVELHVIKGNVIISPIKKARQGWDELYITMHEEGDDTLVLNDSIDLD